MRKLLVSVLPQRVINNFWHLPKAILANHIFGFPTRKLTVLGVTGTDGKTTTTNMIYQILKEAGKKVSMISSINASVAGKTYDTGFHVTSPQSLMVQKFARYALNHGDEFLVLEVTSHALDQYRFWGIKFQVVVITNITHEHLDYHQTFDNYLNIKLKLIKKAKYAVINQNIGGIWGDKVISFGLSRGDFNQRKLRLKLKIPGRYNIENALAAMAVADVLGIDVGIARKGVENFTGLKGRMEEVKNDRGIKIVIDFAHTPNALEQALKTLRKVAKGRLISVFGAASERDVLKRPMMGKIAAQLADITILTDEDPRFEDRNKIIDDIAQGFYSQGGKAGKNLYKEPDRDKAIKLAIALARENDLIGIFGKGCEKSINIKGVEKPWSDFAAVKAALK